VEKTIWLMLAQESLKALGAFRLLSLWGEIYLLIKQVFDVCIILILYIESRHIDEYIKCFCRQLTKLFWSL
jgi:hypothetical protein